MPYNVKFTDELNKGSIIVEDSEINTDTSLGFVGRNVADYGETLNTNFLKLLENFANANPPVNPVEGQLWYDTREGVDQLKIYDGTGWVAAGGLKKSTSEPDSTNSVNGDLWVNTNTAQLYLYSGGTWILVGPQNSKNTGVQATEIIDVQNNTQDVLEILIDGTTLAIISDENFTPKSAVAGFNKVWEDTSTIIRKGINLSRSIGGDQARLTGTAAYAERLIYGNTEILAENVLRNNIENVLTKKITVQNNNGISIGSPVNTRLTVEGTDSVITHLGSGTFDIKNTEYPAPAIRIKAGDTNNTVGINNNAPVATLDVVGDASISTDLTVGNNIRASGNLTIDNNLNVGNDTDIQGDVTAHHIRPQLTNTYNIGAGDKSYNGAFVSTLYTNNILPLDSNNVITVQAELRGNADTTTKLLTPVKLQLSGDIASNIVEFDGSGVQLKTMLTSITTDIIENQTSGGTALTTDEVLAYRSGTGLVKITQTDFVGALPFFPIGTILPYAGVNEPATLWKFCNGQELEWDKFLLLATALGMIKDNSSTWKYGTDNTTTFRIPDLRGRGTIGNIGMTDGIGVLGAGSNNRITSSEASVLGAVAGDETKTISESNLPEHTHTLESDAGEQFYAFTETIADDTAPEVTAGGGIDNASGFALNKTGGLTTPTNDPIDVTNPYVTTNYIIYVGEEV